MQESNATNTSEGPTVAEVEARTLADVRSWFHDSHKRLTREAEQHRKRMIISVVVFAVILAATAAGMFMASRKDGQSASQELTKLAGQFETLQQQLATSNQQLEQAQQQILELNRQVDRNGNEARRMREYFSSLASAHAELAEALESGHSRRIQAARAAVTACLSRFSEFQEAPAGKE